MRAILPILALGAPICFGCSGVPPVDEDAPRVTYFEPTDPDVVREEAEYRGLDGATLGFVRYVNEADRRDGTAFVYLHGIQSHAGWFEGAAEGLCSRGYDVYCLDRRGSGINRENRGFPSGDVLRYEIYLDDIKAFLDPLRQRFSEIYVIGLSWGGKLAAAYGLAHPEGLAGLILITPGLNSKLDLTAAEKGKTVGGSLVQPSRAVRIPIEPEMFTKDPGFLDKMERDPLNLRQATARFFMQGVNIDLFIRKRIAGNELPVLVFLAGQDAIIDNDAVVELLNRGIPRPEYIVYEDQTHSIQFDAPARLVADILTWVDERS